MIDDETFYRDLKWLLNCPSLLNSKLILETDHLEKAGLNFSPVREFLESKASYRVGYYVESLIQVWLQKQTGVDEIQQAIQIKGPERTLGEIDFLYLQHGISNHLEITLKFYLYESKENHSKSHFVGPNSSDTFETKRDKMLLKQIPLGREHFPEIQTSRVIMKGMIFYPPGFDEPVDQIPKGLNPAHNRGIWIRASDCDWLSSTNGFECGRILTKPFWLSGIIPGSEGVESIETLLTKVSDHFQIKHHPLCLSVGDSSGKETVRAFVVADEWPDQNHSLNPVTSST